jgi:hypothetical protein
VVPMLPEAPVMKIWGLVGVGLGKEESS